MLDPTARTVSSASSFEEQIGPSPRLVRAAHEFEASMMKELMVQLEPGKSGLPGVDEDDAGSNTALGSFAGEALARAISEHGGFGIARSILDRLGHDRLGHDRLGHDRLGHDRLGHDWLGHEPSGNERHQFGKPPKPEDDRNSVPISYKQ